MPKVQPYRDEEGDWRWRRLADNGQTIATSGEGYKHKEHAIKMAGDSFPDDDFDDTFLTEKEAS